MNSVERVKAICRERGIAISKLEKDLGFGNGYIGQLKKGVFPNDRLYKIAEYLETDPDFLATGKTPENKKTATSNGDGKDQDRHDYVNSLFDQLNFENQIDAINFLKMKLQAQQGQDDLKGSV